MGNDGIILTKYHAVGDADCTVERRVPDTYVGTAGREWWVSVSAVDAEVDSDDGFLEHQEYKAMDGGEISTSERNL